MEIKEAIAILARIQEPDVWEPQITREAWQALEMAKEALVKESQGLAKDSVKDLPDTKVENCSEIPNSSDLRQQAIDLLDEQIAICDRALTNPGISMNDEFAVKVEKRSLIAYREKLECLLSTQSEKTHGERTETHTCDLIDRQAAIDALRTCYDTEAVTYTNGNEYISYDQALDLIEALPSAQPETHEKRSETHTCDLIDRQAAIDALRDKFKRTPTNAIRAMDAVKQLPSAEPRERLIAKIDVSEEQIRDVLEKMRNEPVQIMPSAQPEQCEDAVPRASVEYICRKNTVSTNPYEHEYHDKFIQFMDDPEISDFGRWQHSNGFNTALVAVKCDLDKVPSAQLERKKGKWIEDALANNIYHCSECGIDAPVEPTGGTEYKSNHCPNCGADMRGEENETD